MFYALNQSLSPDGAFSGAKWLSGAGLARDALAFRGEKP
jgi:hypothetical protein